MKWAISNVFAKIHYGNLNAVAASSAFCPVFGARRSQDAVPQYTKSAVEGLPEWRRGRPKSRIVADGVGSFTSSTCSDVSQCLV